MTDSKQEFTGMETTVAAAWKPTAVRAIAPSIIANNSSGEIVGDFFRIDNTTFGGWVFASEKPERRLTVDLSLNGVFIQHARAEHFVPELLDLYDTDGCHGFVFQLNDSILAQAGQLTAYLANSDTIVGAAIPIAAAQDSMRRPDMPGAARWLGGLRIVGWACNRTALDQRLRVFAYCGSERVAEGLADKTYEPTPAEPVPSGPFGFDLHLEPSLADGRMHLIRVIDERGIELGGSPLAVATLSDDTIRRGLTGPDEQSRIEFYRRMFPSSLPFTSYAEWKAAYKIPEPATAGSLGFGIVVMGSAEAIAQTIDSIEQTKTVPWFAIAIEGDSLNGSQWDDIVSDLKSEKADRIVVMRAGIRLSDDALAKLALATEGQAEDCIVYSDSEVLYEDGSLFPLCKPAFDFERLMAQGYAYDLAAFSPGLLPAFDANASLSSTLIVAGAFARALERRSPILHLPDILATVPSDAQPSAASLSDAAPVLWRAHTGLPEKTVRVEEIQGVPHPAIRICPQPAPDAHVTIIIPTRDRLELLEACISSIRARTKWPHYDIIVVDNDSRNADTLDYFRELERDGETVLRQPGQFNYARLNNRAADVARGNFLLLLNNDTECIDDNWLTAMLEAATAPDIGAVGAKLLWQSGGIQHGGVVLGPYFGAMHAFNDQLDNDAGYDSLLLVKHEVTAVTAACLLMRRSDYVAVGGLDENLFPVNFNDVDLCLKLRATGKRNIWTPHAKLLHKESASRGRDLGDEREGRASRELRLLRLKWGETLLTDPYYSPALNLDAYPYSAMAWPPRERDVRLNVSPRPQPVR